MEVIHRDALLNVRLKAVVFDFDGTISTLRQGWEQVMKPLMLEMIDPNYDEELEQMVEQYIDESTGIQTIYQMQWLKETAKRIGKNMGDHDEWWYKDEYNRRLMQQVRVRLEDLSAGRQRPKNFMIAGSKEFLERLNLNNIDIYIASGTDESDVIHEVDALGLTKYMTAVAGAPYKKIGCSKESVINDLLQKKDHQNQTLMIAGDGKVEIALGKKVGALTLGVASDEIRLTGINAVKRQKLIKAGADIIIGDFSDIESLAECLYLK